MTFGVILIFYLILTKSMGVIQVLGYDSNTQLTSSVPAWSNYSLVSLREISQHEALMLASLRFLSKKLN